MYDNYSVLMSVYYKEKPEYLKESMLSIYNQTKKTNNFVLVCDGPLGNQLDEVISAMEQLFGKRLHVHRLEKNGGLGNALNIGIKLCCNELIARMDSDDISRPDRCEREINIFNKYPKLGIVSGTVEEFTGDISNIKVARVLPEYHDEIVQFAKKRNPFNHPCVMYKKSEVVKAGSYKDAYLLEDYFLWIRMIQNQTVGYNIQSSLLWMRAGSDMYKRRSGVKYAKSQKKLLDYMLKTKFITNREYLSSLALRTMNSIIPNSLRQYVYKKYLRKSKH